MRVIRLYNLSVYVFLSLGFASSALAQEKSPWTHESEASVVQTSGNTTSESYSAKQKTSYKVDAHTITALARYLQTKASAVETAQQWEAAARYERELNEKWSVFVQHGAESDPYAGYTQRDNTDLGGKFFFIKEEKEKLYLEAGWRNTQTIPSTAAESYYFQSGRLYGEYSKQLNDSVSGKFWLEYLPNFDDADAYLLNYEPSVSVMMNQIFSIKLAYLVKYHNRLVSVDEKREDSVFTTALVAKF